jgi:hypothetical protein
MAVPIERPDGARSRRHGRALLSAEHGERLKDFVFSEFQLGRPLRVTPRRSMSSVAGRSAHSAPAGSVSRGIGVVGSNFSRISVPDSSPIAVSSEGAPESSSQCTLCSLMPTIFKVAS